MIYEKRREEPLLGFALDVLAVEVLGRAGDDDAEEWAIVFAILPTGQVSWHVPLHLAEQAELPLKHCKWDGHTRDLKNTRVRKYIKPKFLG